MTVKKCIMLHTLVKVDMQRTAWASRCALGCQRSSSFKRAACRPFPTTKFHSTKLHGASDSSLCFLKHSQLAQLPEHEGGQAEQAGQAGQGGKRRS